MPEAEIAARGGATKWRTIKTPRTGRIIRVAVVPKAGPRGGHTVASEPVKPDTTTKEETS